MLMCICVICLSHQSYEKACFSNNIFDVHPFENKLISFRPVIYFFMIAALSKELILIFRDKQILKNQKVCNVYIFLYFLNSYFKFLRVHFLFIKLACIIADN